ncbi:hypothetical protein [Paraliobacillus sediminis]|uniref:hypothetical protein n=1 Tax=Paraliobacillus sediminis TaxID=1885916 RepID=UPI000E3C2F0A|nr:hypothetical protein [Paraliobacillus sediminis]
MYKKLLAVFLVSFFILAGFSFIPTDINVDEIIVYTEEVTVNSEVFLQDTQNNSSDATIMEGVNTVLATIEALKDVVEQSPDESKEIIKRGKKLDEDWELIEKKVEDAYPEDYTNIEESLYPLIDAAQSEKPNNDVLKKLITEVNDKLFKFKEKISA